MSDNIYFHYTSLQSCLGILESRRVWLSDYRFLNDKQELRRALDLFLACYPEAQRNALASAISWHDYANYHCVLSLSRSQKILSQWRAYADDGRGVALGFREQFLKFAKIDLVPCQYEEHEKYAKEIAERYSDFAEEVLVNREIHCAENDFMDWVDSRRDEFSKIICDLIALKNPAFEEEQEIRAVMPATREEIKLRVREHLIVPYVETQFWPGDERSTDMHVVLPDIWLGPKSNELNRIALMSGKYGYRYIQKYDCGYV